MIDDVISILVKSKKTTSVPSELKVGFNSIVGVFHEGDAGYKLENYLLSGDLDSSINLVLTLDDHFETLFNVEDELAHLWFVLNGWHYFQMSQMFRYREATVLRFVTTIETHSAITGSIYVLGEKYSKLMAKYENEQHQVDSWVGSKHRARFQML